MPSQSGVMLSLGDEKRLNSGRKRKICVSSWKNKMRKGSRDSGNPYISSRKKPVPGKLPPTEGRVCCCSFHCGDILHQEKLKLFQYFHNLTYNNQTRFLAESCMKVVDINRRRVNEEVSTRHCTVEYYVARTESNVRICQKTLCNIFQITPRRLQILQQKIKFKKPLKDERGKHGKNKVSHESRELVKNHISSFPQQENHYSRNTSNKKCLNPDLSKKKMWKLFLGKNPGVVCSLHLYRDVFNKDFNLRFGVPRSDTCAYCDRLYVRMLSAESENELKAVETESKIHHMRADLAYKSLAQDASISKENRNTVVVCVDLQQVLFCPNLTHSNMFYQRQLSCYNLAIHNQANNKPMMFFWDETVSKRGAAEVSSCILKYIEIHFTPLKPGEARVLILWSDRCIGQNNNWRMIALMQHLVVGNYFSSVEQKFMTTGHSFLPCDRDFAVIERAKKGTKVYIPMHWVEVIANASPSRFEVCVMGTDDFKDLSVVENSLRKGSYKITKQVWYQIASDDPTTLRGRTSHNVLQPWETHSIAKKAQGRGGRNLPPVKVARFPNLYGKRLPIKQAKITDLKDMCRYIPEEFVEFYNNLQGE